MACGKWNVTEVLETIRSIESNLFDRPFLEENFVKKEGDGDGDGNNEEMLGLEQPYAELCGVLRESLLSDDPANSSSEERNTKRRRWMQRNRFLLLVGPHGNGKKTLLAKALRQIRAATANKQRQRFRVVSLDATQFVNGDDGSVVREILRQLQDRAEVERDEHLVTQLSSSQPSTSLQPLAQFGQSSFHANIHALDAVLLQKHVDGVPILIVFHGIDDFCHSSQQTQNKNSLLYFLLQRVSSHNYRLSIVALTTSRNTNQLLQRRIVSRAEGNFYTIYCGRPETLESLVEWLSSRFSVQKHEDIAVHMLKIFQTLLQEPTIRDMFRLAFVNGNSVRWFCRILLVAMSRMRFDLECGHTNNPCLTKQHLLWGFQSMGMSPSTTTLSTNSPRTRCLWDLTEAQLSVLLAYRRLFHRNLVAVQEKEEVLSTDKKPLIVNFDALCKEYQNTFRQKQPKFFQDHVLFQSFRELLDLHLLTFVANSPKHHFTCYQMLVNEREMHTLPVRCTLHLTMELDPALKSKRLDCSTAVREWGLRID